MSGYRFCRTDDVPRLVAAHNLCAVAHEPGAPPLTIEAFKRDVREQGLWASSSMLAFDGDETIGVLLGAKRDDANLVHHIAVVPAHRRRGHGRHLLESLRRKVAILGPPRLLAEVPAENPVARRFFERCGFLPRTRYVDFAADGPRAAGPSTADIVSPITFAELRDAGALAAVDRPWPRSLQALAALGEQARGLAVASDRRIEAYVLHRRLEHAVAILAIGGPEPSLLHLVVARLYEREGGPLVVARASEDEISFEALRALGFRAGAEHVGYEAALGEDT